MSETSDEIAIRFERGGHRAIALTDATCKGRAKDVQPPLSAEQIAAILADYRGTVARTAHGGSPEDFASLAAWLPALAARCAALEERVGVLTGALEALAAGSVRVQRQWFRDHGMPDVADRFEAYSDALARAALAAAPPPDATEEPPA